MDQESINKKIEDTVRSEIKRIDLLGEEVILLEERHCTSGLKDILSEELGFSRVDDIFFVNNQNRGNYVYVVRDFAHSKRYLFAVESKGSETGYKGFSSNWESANRLEKQLEEKHNSAVLTKFGATPESRPSLNSEDLLKIEVGPFDHGIDGRFGVELMLDGDFVSSCQVEFGYSRKNFEKRFFGMDIYSALPLVSRISPSLSNHYELLFSLAAEDILGIKLSRRAHLSRVVLCELERVLSNLEVLARFSKSLDLNPAYNYFLREREKVLALFELVSGSRLNCSMIIPGGIRQDVTAGFLNRVKELCFDLKFRLDEYDDLLVNNPTSQMRMLRVAEIPSDVAIQNHFSGPNLRASGINYDLRRDAPYGGYKELLLTVSIGSAKYGKLGDVFDRIVVRLKDIESSLGILETTIDRIEPGDHYSAVEAPSRMTGAAHRTIETPRGQASCFLEIDDHGKIKNINFTTPSRLIRGFLPNFFTGIRVDDVSLAFESLGFSTAEADL